MRTELTHTCHAIACSEATKPEMLMCYRHWTMVPKTKQRDVWVTYRRGQCTDWKITQAYADAAKAAITAVARREGRRVTGKEIELTGYDHLVKP